MGIYLMADCARGTQNSSLCGDSSPCEYEGLCYNLDGSIPEHVLGNPKSGDLMHELSKDCSLQMYQSKEHCPKENCQWMGGKHQRCQKRRSSKKNIKTQTF